MRSGRELRIGNVTKSRVGEEMGRNGKELSRKEEEVVFLTVLSCVGKWL